MKTKNPGAATLIVSVILSGLILTVGLGLARLLSTELQFSADLMLGERAYFAAESGVETALWALQKNDENISQDPVNSVTDDESGVVAYLVPGGKSSFALEIASRKTKFEVTLPPRRPIKLLLRRDLDPKLSTNMQPVQSLDITLSEDAENAPLDWKILCPGESLQSSDSAGTVELHLTNSLESFKKMTGLRDNGNATKPMYADAFLNGVDDSTKCYLSITNFGDIDTALIFETTDGMSPFAPLVTARGMAGNREKEVSFRYRQKNLSELFGFGLFHKGL